MGPELLGKISLHPELHQPEYANRARLSHIPHPIWHALPLVLMPKLVGTKHTSLL